MTDAGAQALHREGEVGEPVVASQGLADQTERADIEAPVLGRGVAQQTGVAERGDQPAAATVDVMMVDERGRRWLAAQASISAASAR